MREITRGLPDICGYKFKEGGKGEGERWSLCCHEVFGAGIFVEGERGHVQVARYEQTRIPAIVGVWATEFVGPTRNPEMGNWYCCAQAHVSSGALVPRLFYFLSCSIFYYMNVPLFIHSPVGHLGCFQFFC